MRDLIENLGYVIIVEVVLIANGIAILLDIMPSWWYSGYYTLPHWIGAAVSFLFAAIIAGMVALTWKDRR